MVERASEHSVDSSSERRARWRLPVRGFAVVRSGHAAMLAETVDISEQGVCLTLPEALDVGGTYRVDLEIQGDHARSTSVVARVCFCLQGKNGYRVGLNCSLGKFLGS